MNTKYYIISNEDARQMGVTEFRLGSPEKGYIVNSGDFGVVNGEILARAQEVSEKEAKEFIEKL